MKDGLDDSDDEKDQNHLLSNTVSRFINFHHGLRKMLRAKNVPQKRALDHQA